MKRAVEATSTQAAMPAPAVMATGEHTQTTDPRNDPMRRFVPTPYTACLPVMGSTVRLETNNSKLLEHMVELFARYPGAASGHSTFLWRIVVDSDIQVGQPWPRRSAFSGDGLPIWSTWLNCSLVIQERRVGTQHFFGGLSSIPTYRSASPGRADPLSQAMDFVLLILGRGIFWQSISK